MNEFAFAFSSVFPLFVYMGLGFIIRKAGWANDVTMEQMNAVTFKTFLPIMIFVNVYKSEPKSFPGLFSVLFPFVAVILICAVTWIAIERSALPQEEKGVMIQAVFRSNYVLFGFPLVQALTGGVGSGITEVLVAIIVPLFNVLAVIVLSHYGDRRVNGKQLIRRILTNPLILASTLGIAAKLLQLQLPQLLLKPLDALGKVATPLALIILGAQFRFSDSGRYFKKLLVAGSLRLVAVPGICLSLAALFGARGEVLISYLALFGGPVAVSSYTMAYQMGSDERLAGQILVYTSAFSLLTLFLFLLIMRKSGLV